MASATFRERSFQNRKEKDEHNARRYPEQAWTKPRTGVRESSKHEHRLDAPKSRLAP